MSNDFDDHKGWLENIDMGTRKTRSIPTPTTRTSPNGSPPGTEQLRSERQIVSSLAVLRKHGAALTQTQFDQRWKRVQSSVAVDHHTYIE